MFAAPLPEPERNPTTTAEAVTSPDLKSFIDYWQSKKGKRRMPSRADIDPVDFGPMLGRVSLVEVLSGAPRFRMRLASTQMTQFLGYELTGQPLEAVREPEGRQLVLTQLEQVVATGAPLFDVAPHVLDGRVWRGESAYLPLSADGKRVDMILIARLLDAGQRTFSLRPVMTRSARPRLV